VPTAGAAFAALFYFPFTAFSAKSYRIGALAILRQLAN